MGSAHVCFQMVPSNISISSWVPGRICVLIYIHHFINFPNISIYFNQVQRAFVKNYTLSLLLT
ncbi:hypothetical protein CFP56_014786, partial [Quercus suber]